MIYEKDYLGGFYNELYNIGAVSKGLFVTAGFIPVIQFSYVFATIKVADTNFPEENQLLRQPLIIQITEFKDGFR